MATSYAYNNPGGRHEPGNRLGSQAQQTGGSQQNLTGTLTRTEVGRRGAQFHSARPRMDSDNAFLDGRASPTSNLRRNAARSQDRLNSSSSISSSRSNLSQQPQNSTLRRGFVTEKPPQNYQPSPQQQPPQNYQPSPQQQPPQQQYGPGEGNNYHNYSNVPPYKPNNTGNYVDPDSMANMSINNSSNNNNNKSINRDRDNVNSTSSIHSVSTPSNNVASPNVAATATSVADSKFHEFEKVRVDYLRRGKLYEDTVFLPTDMSAYFSTQPPMDLEWVRARDIAHMHRQQPKFVVRGFDRFDVQQGQLGDCWFVAAIACLSCPEYRHLFERVIPRGQSFQENWYSGVFRFMFWHFGEWKQVLVDDFLPTNRGRPVFVHSSQPNEFWSCLMEKAYAKLYGSYEALKGGQMMDSLTDLTGGVTEHYTLRGEYANVPHNIVNILFKALERLSLIGAGIKGTGERVLQNGLVSGHAYSVTDLRRILHGQQPVNLIRIRNPHGDSKEWRGRWSEWSSEMQQISPEDRQQLGLIQRDDGEFWMDFEDFLANFDVLDICNLTPDAVGDVQRKWHAVEHHGRWVKGFNAGGRQSREASHWANPQYLLKLEDTDEDEDQVCTVVVQLMQKDRRKIKQKGENFRFIGFYIYELEKGYTMPAKKDFFDYNRDIDNSGAFSNVRQVTKRVSLPPGAYLVVPCTWDADEEADFFIRFFFEKGNVAEYCDDKPEKVEVPPPPVSPEVREQEESFKQFFYRVSGEDMEVNAFELKDAINEGLRKEPLHRDISVDACRSFVCLMDVDGSGKLSFHEFQFLWHHLRSWKKIFYQFDTDNSGSIDSRELRYAVNGAGYKISNRTIAQLIFKFADENGRISLDNFLTLLARLMKTFNSFHDMQRDGAATLNLEQWLDRTLVL